MVVATALCRRVGGQRHQRLGQSEGGYSKIHLSILLPNKLQIILDNIAVLNEQKRERGGSRFENRFDDLTP